MVQSAAPSPRRRTLVIPPYMLHLQGAYGSHNRVELRRELEAAAGMGGIVVIDLRGCSEIDEDAIVEFGKTRDKLRADGGQLRFLIDDRALEHRFHDSSDTKFDVYGSPEAAMLDC